MQSWNNKHNEIDFEQSEELQMFINGDSKPPEPIQEQKEEIIVISTSMPLMRTISFISSAVFSLALFIKFLYNCRQLSFIYISLPFSVTFISLIMYLNSAIMIQGILSKGKITKISTITSYICLNTGGLSMLIFICLFSLKLDRIISLSLLSVLTPFFLCGSIYILYGIILMPMLNTDIDWEFNIMTGVDSISIMICGFLIKNKIDNSTDYSFAYCFSPVYVCLLLNLVYYYFNSNQRKGEMMRLFGICIIGFGVAALQFKFDLILINESHWMDIALICIGYYSISFEFIFGTFSEDIKTIENSSSGK